MTTTNTAGIATASEKKVKFSPELFDEALGILQTNINQGKYGLTYLDVLKLAFVAGGEILTNSMCKKGFVQCTPDFKCENCWMTKYCIHKDVPIELRKEFSDYIDLTVASFDQLDPDFVDYVIKVDKTDLQLLKELNAKLKELLDDPTFVQKEETLVKDLIEKFKKTLEKLPDKINDSIKDK